MDSAEVMVPNSCVLMSPDMATTLVSRSEIVNLVVVEYLDKIRDRITAAEVEEQRLRRVCSETWRLAYTAWHDQIRSRVEARLEPWRAAVSAALDGAAMSNLVSEQLPDPAQCTFHLGVTGPTRQQESHRDFTGIPDLIRFWLPDALSAEAIDFDAPVRGGKWGDQQVGLSNLVMRWSFAPVRLKYGTDWHALTIPVDVRPTDKARELVLTAIGAYRDHLCVFRRVSDLHNEIDEKNIVSLERRALAKLTKQSLGGATTRPSLDEEP